MRSPVFEVAIERRGHEGSERNGESKEADEANRAGQAITTSPHPPTGLAAAGFVAKSAPSGPVPCSHRFATSLGHWCGYVGPFG